MKIEIYFWIMGSMSAAYWIASRFVKDSETVEAASSGLAAISVLCAVIWLMIVCLIAGGKWL